MKDVCKRSNGAFSVYRLFFPVYSVNATVTYDWEEDSTQDNSEYTITTKTHYADTKTFNHDFYRNIHNSCKADVYVGRSDERFYRLAHVDDLGANIYNKACVYNESSLENSILLYARKLVPNTDSIVQRTINRWSAVVCFVPIAVVSYKYKGETYTATVNMHNGHAHLEYVVSQKTTVKAVTMRRMSLFLRILSWIFSVGSVVLGLFLSIWALILAVAWCIVLYYDDLDTTFHTKEYFLKEYGAKDSGGIRLIKAEILYVAGSILVPILLWIIF